MYDRPVPAGLGSIEDWLLQDLYDHPNDKHSTLTLLQQLGQVLKDEPSQLDECNRLRGIMGAAPLSPEEYTAERTPTRGAVQRAVETLIREGWANGKRNRDADGVFFEGLDLTGKGTREALSRANAKERREAPDRGPESIIRRIHERMQKEADEGRNDA
ncbi:MAG: hypothetical protein ABSC77_10150 [Terracidiphilus sp.]|jgi:hypothetical protein